MELRMLVDNILFIRIKPQIGGYWGCPWPWSCKPSPWLSHWPWSWEPSLWACLGL